MRNCGNTLTRAEEKVVTLSTTMERLHKTLESLIDHAHYGDKMLRMLRNFLFSCFTSRMYTVVEIDSDLKSWIFSSKEGVTV